MAMSIYEKINMKKANNNIINKVTADVSGIIGKPCWNEFNWRCGKVLGLLRTLMNNRNIPAVFEVSGIEEEIIDLYYEVAGNLPYIDKNGQFNAGRPQFCDELIELMQYVYDKLGLTAAENEFSDITQEHWESLHNSAIERIRKTLEVTSNIQYEE
jgi:hypothetical protein